MDMVVCVKQYQHVDTSINEDNFKKKATYSENILVTEQECRAMVVNRTCLGKNKIINKLICDLNSNCVYNENINVNFNDLTDKNNIARYHIEHCLTKPVLLKGNKNVMRPDCPVEKLTCAHMYDRYIWDRKIVKKSQFYIVKKIQFKKKANTYISEEFQLLFHSTGNFDFETIAIENTTSAFYLADSKFENLLDIYENIEDIDYKLNLKIINDDFITNFLIKHIRMEVAALQCNSYKTFLKKDVIVQYKNPYNSNQNLFILYYFITNDSVFKRYY